MKKEQKITVRAWVHVGDQLVNVDTLSPEMKQRLATELNLSLMNALYAGRAVFTVAKEPDKCGPGGGRPEASETHT
jgi:hypothetical protein